MWQGLVVIRGTYVNDVERAFVGLYLLTFPMAFVFRNGDRAIIDVWLLTLKKTIENKTPHVEGLGRHISLKNCSTRVSHQLAVARSKQRFVQ